MKKLFTLLVLAFYFNVNAQIPSLQQSKKLQNKIVTAGNRLGNGGYQQTQNIIALYDSIYYWKFDTSAMVWKFRAKSINFTYDAHLNNKSYTFQNWTNNSWVNNAMYSYTYNSSNNQTVELIQNWTNNAWVNNSMYSYTYDSNNNRIIELTQNWNDTSSIWVNNERDSSTYNSNNKIAKYNIQNWAGTSWANSPVEADYYYDSFNNLTSEVDVIHGQSGSGFSSNYTYDSNNNMISEEYQNTQSGLLVDDQQTSNSYNTNNKKVYSYTKERTYTQSNFAPISQSSYTYDVNNNLTTQLNQKWVGSGGFAFANSSISTYTYDANSLLRIAVAKNIDGIKNDKVLTGDSTVYYFNAVTGIKQVATNNNQLNIYPNPTQNNFTIETNNTDKQTLQIFDVNGKLVLTQTINGKTNIDVTNLAEGVYNLSLINLSGVINKRLVIVR